MPTSSQSAAVLTSPETEFLQEAEPGSSQRGFPPVALSSRARERLRVLNQVLETPAKGRRDSNSEDAILG